jgi:hypothetical protein
MEGMYCMDKKIKTVCLFTHLSWNFVSFVT